VKRAAENGRAGRNGGNGAGSEGGVEGPGSAPGVPVKVEIAVRPGSDVVPVRRCRSFLSGVGQQLGVEKGRVSVLFCSDGEIAEIRGRLSARNRPTPTDVLSFPSGEPFPGEGRHLGDIVVSTETATRQAHVSGRTVEREVLTLLVHGFLHLLGYDHETDQGEMMRLQRKICGSLIPGDPASRRGSAQAGRGQKE